MFTFWSVYLSQVFATVQWYVVSFERGLVALWTPFHPHISLFATNLLRIFRKKGRKKVVVWDWVRRKGMEKGEEWKCVCKRERRSLGFWHKNYKLFTSRSFSAPYLSTVCSSSINNMCLLLGVTGKYVKSVQCSTVSLHTWPFILLLHVKNYFSLIFIAADPHSYLISGMNMENILMKLSPLSPPSPLFTPWWSSGGEGSLSRE